MSFRVQQIALVLLGVVLVALPGLGIVDEIYGRRQVHSVDQVYPLIRNAGIGLIVIAMARLVMRPVTGLAGRKARPVDGTNSGARLLRWFYHVDRQGRDRDTGR